MRCICVLRKENDEQGSNLANQACQWKYEMISVEIDIKITGNGCTVCKWQAKQEGHESAINSMIALRMQQVTMLQHSNVATKHMTVIYRRCLQKMNTELRLDNNTTGSNKHGKSAKDISITDLVKNTNMSKTTSGSNV